MKHENESAELEQPVARITITADAGYLLPIVNFVRQTAHRLGIRDEAAERLDLAVEVVCRNVIENAFGSDEDGRYDVYVLRRPGQVVVAVEDRGLPGDYARFESGEDSTLRGMLQHSFAEEVRFLTSVAVATGWS